METPMIKTIRPRTAFLLLGVTCLALVLGSVGMTRWFQLEPCPLCIFQRLLYLLVGLFALAAAAWWRGAVVAGALALMAALGGLATAVYQSWMQAFPERFITCGIGVPTNPIEKLVDRLGEISPTFFYAWGECTSREWVFLGMSLANWSVFFFLGLAAVLGWLTWRVWWGRG
jgi:disulfide bond formation protein DsbB